MSGASTSKSVQVAILPPFHCGNDRRVGRMTPYLSRMAGRRGSRLGVVFGVLAIACVAPAPSPSPSPTPIELGDGPPTVTVDSDGITLALWLDRSEVTIGDTVLALV